MDTNCLLTAKQVHFWTNTDVTSKSHNRVAKGGPQPHDLHEPM
jgi:hypothetical protein